MDAQIEKIVIVFGSVFGVILLGTLLTNQSDKNIEIEKPKTLGRRPKSFLTSRQKTRKISFHRNKLPTINEDKNEIRKEDRKTKTLKRK